MNMHAQLKAAMDNAVATGNSMETSATVIPIPVNAAGNVGIGTTNDDVDVPVNASTPKPKLKNISEKALLFKLSQSKFSTNTRDVNKTNEYQAGTVIKKLFKGDNLVSKARSAHDEVYNYVRDNTLPWDVGVRLVNANFFTEFSAEVRRLIAEADASVVTLAANWDAVWQADFARIEAIGHATNNPTLADINDYPADISLFYSNRTLLTPIGKASDIDVRWGVTEEDVAAYEQALSDRDSESGKNVITNLLKPMEAAIESLAKPVDDVKKFYTSVVTNMTDVCHRMTRANVSDDPNVAQCITDLATLAGGLNIDLLKHNQTARTDAVAMLTALAAKFKGYL